MLSHPFPSYSPVGWYSRAKPFPYELPYEILENNLVFGISIHSMVTQGPAIALFRPNIAVDVRGRVLILKQVDWDAITEIAGATTNLPRARMRNTWSMNPGYFCIPYQIIHIPTLDGNRVINIEGWVGESSELSIPVGNITHLPDSLQLLLKYSSEAWANFYGGERNKVVLADTKKMLRYESEDDGSLDDLD
ncbi:unnamed protein product [Rhizoctonia solani]|uniref:Uncharacterized protein n=1 Tax=Rhizoctonia solani TaxID=456999 RepID=A0A8H2XZI3_9AGAM|nr:unnamed protein product [Rhizoctonia solani]